MLANRPIVHSRLAWRGVLSAALLIGTAQHTALAHDHGPHEDGNAGRVAAELHAGNIVRAVALGEAAVAATPQDAVLRAELGHAYLRAGRFESAAAALGDALALSNAPGPGNPGDRITLSLALAQIASGQNRAALATLDHAGNIAPAELGLALALAGDAGRGIAVLSDAVRDGSGSANLRQNLAYAFALDGRWADATLTAGFDLPPDQVTARLQQWAQTMQAGGERVRIARLLDVPLIADAGMPAALALKADPAPVMAVAALPPAPAVAVADPAPPLSAIVAPVQQVAIALPTMALFHRLGVQAHGVSPHSSHFVQLAAYHSRRSAERGRVILSRRHALLRGHGLMITQARSHGRTYWRVVMAGFDGATAASLCASLQRHGAACFAYSSRPQGQGSALALAASLKRPAFRP